LGQIVEGLQVLQSNRVLSIPHSHSTAEIIHCAGNRLLPLSSGLSKALNRQKISLLLLPILNYQSTDTTKFSCVVRN
jgi:hypothetical protein